MTMKKKDSRSARTQSGLSWTRKCPTGKRRIIKNVREPDELKTYQTQFKTVLMILYFKKSYVSSAEIMIKHGSFQKSSVKNG